MDKDAEFREAIVAWMDGIDATLEEAGIGRRTGQGRFVSLTKSRDSRGLPRLRVNSGGRVYTFEAMSSKPKPTFADKEKRLQNPNPVVLDSSGSATIYWDGAYSVRVDDAYGNAIESFIREPQATQSPQETRPAVARP